MKKVGSAALLVSFSVGMASSVGAHAEEREAGYSNESLDFSSDIVDEKTENDKVDYSEALKSDTESAENKTDTNNDKTAENNEKDSEIGVYVEKNNSDTLSDPNNSGNSSRVESPTSSTKKTYDYDAISAENKTDTNNDKTAENNEKDSEIGVYVKKNNSDTLSDPNNGGNSSRVETPTSSTKKTYDYEAMYDEIENARDEAKKSERLKRNISVGILAGTCFTGLLYSGYKSRRNTDESSNENISDVDAPQDDYDNKITDNPENVNLFMSMWLNAWPIVRKCSPLIYNIFRDNPGDFGVLKYLPFILDAFEVFLNFLSIIFFLLCDFISFFMSFIKSAFSSWYLLSFIKSAFSSWNLLSSIKSAFSLWKLWNLLSFAGSFAGSSIVILFSLINPFVYFLATAANIFFSSSTGRFFLFMANSPTLEWIKFAAEIFSPYFCYINYVLFGCKWFSRIRDHVENIRNNNKGWFDFESAKNAIGKHSYYWYGGPLLICGIFNSAIKISFGVAADVGTLAKKLWLSST